MCQTSSQLTTSHNTKQTYRTQYQYINKQTNTIYVCIVSNIHFKSILQYLYSQVPTINSPASLFAAHSTQHTTAHSSISSPPPSKKPPCVCLPTCVLWIYKMILKWCGGVVWCDSRTTSTVRMNQS